MHDPFDHVRDHAEWHFLANDLTGEWTIHLPVLFEIPSFSLFGYEFGPHRFQLTKYMVLEVIAAVIVAAIYIPLARRVRTGEPPKGYLWNTFEVVLTFLRDQVAKPNLGEEEADKYVPFLWTLFLFILACNLLGMLPFMGSPTGAFSVTLTLAAIAFCAIHGYAIAAHGLWHYLKSYVPHIDVPLILGIFLIPMIMAIEIMGHFIKAFVLAVRLFANMFAGHTVLAFILFFIVMAKQASPLLLGVITVGSVLGVTALSLLELFVAFLQAFIFTFLTSLFMGSTLHPEH
jgi:F-type H+-transporting ATPase subunit a